MLRSRRLAFAAAALILGLSACGDAKSTTIGAKAPAVIHVGSNGGKLAAGATADRSMMPYIGIVTYVFDGQFPDLGTTGSAWSLPVGQQPDLARILAVARTLGVQGDVRTLPVDQGGGWVVGPNDGTGPSLNVANDGLLSWWYNGMSSPTSVGCAKTEPSSGGVAAVPLPPETTVLVDPCQPPPPPANVPDKATALAKAKDLMASVGVNAADYDFTAYADQYSASVTGFLQVGGHRSSLQTNVGFGAEGAVMWASGLLATPQPAADYPLVSGDIALQRLNDPSGRWMFFGGPRPMNGVGIAGDSITNSAGGGSTPTVGAPDPATGSASVGSSGAIVAPMPPATIIELAQKLPGLNLMNAYGSTETTSPATLLPAGQSTDHGDSVGLAVACGELAVMDPQRSKFAGDVREHDSRRSLPLDGPASVRT